MKKLPIALSLVVGSGICCSIGISKSAIADELPFTLSGHARVNYGHLSLIHI